MRTIVGTVVSDKADKTIVLATTTRKTHPIYKKQYSKTTKYIAHDENNEARVGDVVEVKEVRPISARKRLSLVKVVEKAKLAEAETVAAVTAKDEDIAPASKETKPNEAAEKAAEEAKKIDENAEKSEKPDEEPKDE